MKLRLAMLGCLLLAGCSKLAPFNFSFSAEDGGSGGNDLAVVGDLATGTSDLAGEDLGIADDLASADLHITADLTTPPDGLPPIKDQGDTKDMVKIIDQSPPSDQAVPSDLRPADMAPVTDMIKIKSPLGGPCGGGSGITCEGNLTCVDGFTIDNKNVQAPGGYCSKQCGMTSEPTNECGNNGTCQPFGAVSYCVRVCDVICPTGRNLSVMGPAEYACCSQGSVQIGCLPIAADKRGGLSCTAINGPGSGG